MERALPDFHAAEKRRDAARRKKGGSIMKKSVWTRLLLAWICLLLILPGALAETRQGVIQLEGQEEAVEEKLYECPQGFSFWYVPDRVEAYHDVVGNIDGVFVCALYSDDHMILSMIPEEDAAEYTEDLERNIVELSADSRVQMDVYHDLEDGRYYFLTLIGEKGAYFRAVGEYSQEAAEGNAKFLQRILDSVTFLSDPPSEYPAEDPSDAPYGDDFEAYERSVLIEGQYYTLGESTLRDFERGGWAWTQDADGRFSFEVTEEGNYFYARTDNDRPDGKLVMVDLFYAYDISYEYLGFGFDRAYDPGAETDIYTLLEETYDSDYTDEGVLYARTEVAGGTLLIEVGEGALRLTLE